MSFYKTFKTDKNLEADQGVDLDYGADGVITIRRAGGSNRKFQTVSAAKLKPYTRRIQNGTIEPKELDLLMAEIYADSVIVGWRGVKDENGKDLPFTRENVIKLLTDLPDLFEDIQAQADKVSTFRKEETEEAIKNSQKS